MLARDYRRAIRDPRRTFVSLDYFLDGGLNSCFGRTLDHLGAVELRLLGCAAPRGRKNVPKSHSIPSLVQNLKHVVLRLAVIHYRELQYEVPSHLRIGLLACQLNQVVCVILNK